MLGGGEGLELGMEHSRPGMTSLGEVTGEREAHPLSAWGQALERVDLRRAAEEELMTAQGLPRPLHFLHGEGLGGVFV